MSAEPLRYSKDQAAQALGVCRRTVDLMIRYGYLRTVRTGKRVFVVRRDVEMASKIDLPNLWLRYRQEVRERKLAASA